MKLVFVIVAAAFVVYLLQGLSYTVFPVFTDLFALIPTVAFSGAVWQFVTYMFLHGGPEHILLNMVVLLIFGVPVEQALGSRRFAVLYFLSGIGSALLYIALTGIGQTPLIGASGAVFGVMVAFARLFPEQRLVIFPIPIPIRAAVAVVLITAFELVAGVTGLMPGIANFGHVGGIVAGLLIIEWFRHRGGRRAREFKGLEFAWE